MKRLIQTSHKERTAVRLPIKAPAWTFLSNHSHVLICLAREPEARLRDVAEHVGITERAVQKIVRELELGGVLSRFRLGRCNRYNIHSEKTLRHQVEKHCTVRQLLNMTLSPDELRRLEG